MAMSQKHEGVRAEFGETNTSGSSTLISLSVRILRSG
jgi:hypothetical protein